MGPTNLALVRLFEADQKYREAQSRYDAASRNVRLQERRVNELSSRLQASHAELLGLQAKAGTLDLDVKSRDEAIERLRTQQQTAKNNKEYQNFLIQINTAKVDKAKVEDEMLKLMEQVEKLQAGCAQVTAQVDTEKAKLEQIRTQITGRLEELQKDVEATRPIREAAAAALPASIVQTFDRLADRFEGEAMAAISKPDRRVEEYHCGVCNMGMAVDIYNRLHTRDEPMTCPSCRRLLYIPDDLPPAEAINQKKAPKKSRGKGGDEEVEETSPASADQA